MHKRLLLISMLFSGAYGYSQKILNSPQQAGTVLDPVSISLQLGFSFSSSSGDFIARIGSGSTTSITGNNNTGYTPIAVNYTNSFSSGENYIYTREYLVPVTSENPAAQQIQSIQFFDGLGRPKQTVSIKSTPTGKDLVTAIPYDGFGRQVDSYLPVPLSTMNGNAHQNVESSTLTYYQGNGINDSAPFTHKTLENSPLDRLLSVTNPGGAWQSTPVNFNYEANSQTDAVKKFTTQTTWVSGRTYSQLLDSGIYSDAQLYKNTITDEDKNVSIEFKNGQGQTLLVRKMLGTTPVDTYYVYNEYDQLAFVIPPKAVGGSPATNLSVRSELCYQYRYDGRNRLVEKRLPGKGDPNIEESGWDYMVYDGQDRLVATQDPEMRKSGGWLFTKYDQFGRVVYTGITIGSTARSTEQSYADVSGNNNAIRNNSSGVTASGVTAYYSNDLSPMPNGTSPAPYPPTINELLSINYYDAYPADISYLPASDLEGKPILSGNPQSTTTSAQVSLKGLPVASYIRNIEKNASGGFDWNKSYTYYDLKGRPVGNLTANYLGGYTRTASKLKFSGKPEYTLTYHKRNSASPEVELRDDYEYDHQERLVRHSQKVNNGPAELLAENIYNDLGQLDYKNVGNGIQSIDYSYNIRGWMAKVNDPANLGEKLFAMELKYQDPQNTGTTANPKKYNGNIAQIDWATQSDGQLRRYDFRYDNLNRMNEALYSKPKASVISTNAYNESLVYDLNGNIGELVRYGGLDGIQAMQIDELKYVYSGNRLKSVTDVKQNVSGYPTGGNIIDYDDNGNMINQNDKGISNIYYNFLNLPNQITYSKGNTGYVYRADGVKLKKTFGTNKTNDYLEGFQYENGVLQFMPTSEGYYDFTKNAYIYNYVDHLGNVRLSYRKNSAGVLEILEENNYYPFGLKHEGYNNVTMATPSYKYKYQGQELQETGWYSFKWRNYMPDVGRFFNIDPLAEKYSYNSPYAFSENRVIDGRELEGLEWVKSTTLNQDGTKTYTFNGAIKLVNNSKTYTAQDIKNFQTDLTQKLKDSFNGTLSNDDKIEIGEVSYSLVDKVQEGDYSLSFNDVVIGNDGKPMEGNVKGKNQSPDHIGNSQENNMQVVPSGKDTAEYATHEVGHSLGLRHQRDDKNSKEIKDKMTPINLMYSPQFPGSGAKVIPEQRNVIINNVPDEEKTN